MGREHRYAITTRWTGNLGTGTSSYQAYSRDHEIDGSGKSAPLPGSSDPVFRGDATRYSPEDMLVASLSACHMLWLLHLAADAGIVITSYTDQATGTMRETEDGGGEFTEVTLHPRVTVSGPARAAELEELHHRAHELCFIARSVRFPVYVSPEIS